MSTSQGDIRMVLRAWVAVAVATAWGGGMAGCRGASAEGAATVGSSPAARAAGCDHGDCGAGGAGGGGGAGGTGGAGDAGGAGGSRTARAIDALTSFAASKGIAVNQDQLQFATLDDAVMAALPAAQVGDLTKGATVAVLFVERPRGEVFLGETPVPNGLFVLREVVDPNNVVRERLDVINEAGDRVAELIASSIEPQTDPSPTTSALLRNRLQFIVPPATPTAPGVIAAVDQSTCGGRCAERACSRCGTFNQRTRECNLPTSVALDCYKGEFDDCYRHFCSILGRTLEIGFAVFGGLVETLVDVGEVIFRPAGP